MEPTRRKPLWLLPLLLVIVLAGVFAAREWQPATTQITSSAIEPATAESVELTIDAGDGAPRVVSAPWRAGLTVQDALATAEGVTFAVQGQGEKAFLAELNGQPNEGSSGRNWLFEVNGQMADRSMGVYELQPGDHVLWKFTKSE